MTLHTVRERAPWIPLVILGLFVMFILTQYVEAGPADPPATTGSTGDGNRSGSADEKPPQSGLDNTPGGGTLPGGTVPGGTMPGGTLPGGTVPGGALPGGTVPGGTLPGGTVPSERLPGEDG